MAWKPPEGSWSAPGRQDLSFFSGPCFQQGFGLRKVPAFNHPTAELLNSCLRLGERLRVLSEVGDSPQSPCGLLAPSLAPFPSKRPQRHGRETRRHRPRAAAHAPAPHRPLPRSGPGPGAWRAARRSEATLGAQTGSPRHAPGARGEAVGRGQAAVTHTSPSTKIQGKGREDSGVPGELAESTGAHVAGERGLKSGRGTDQASAEEKSELYLVSFPNETLKVEAARTHTYTQKRWTSQSEHCHTAGYKLTDSERVCVRPTATVEARGAAGGALSDPRPPRLR